MQHLVQIVGILMCWIVLVVGAQSSKPQSQHIAINERRRYLNGDYSGYGSFSASSASSVPSEFIKFPDDRSISSATVKVVRNDNSGNNFNDRHKTYADETIIQSDSVDTSQLRTVRDEVSYLLFYTYSVGPIGRSTFIYEMNQKPGIFCLFIAQKNVYRCDSNDE